LNLNDSPEGSFNESVTGLKESFPENAMAVTIVGEARKFIVRLLPSLRDLKLLNQIVRQSRSKAKGPYRLNEVKIALKESNVSFREQNITPPFAPSFVSSRFHYRDQRMNTVTHFIQRVATYLPNARSASVRQNNGPDILKNLCYVVALHRCSNLFRSGGTEKGNLTDRSEMSTT
jgi:hypothetical protein